MISIRKLYNTPFLLKKITRTLIRDTAVGKYQFRYGIGALRRPNYAYLVYQAAKLARRLGEQKVSILEFGVAGGDGLLAMEYHAENIEKIFGVTIEVFGFDTGVGLLAPIDYRDLPYHWKSGFYKMDVPLLQSRLKRSKLVIGDVRETVQTFVTQFSSGPIGAISYDLDYYSSTVAALKLLDAPSRCLLPRLPIYFDDVVGGEVEYYNDYTGVRLAIAEFNNDHTERKLSPLYYLRDSMEPAEWYPNMWSFHAFDHPQYMQFVGEENQQLPI